MYDVLYLTFNQRIGIMNYVKSPRMHLIRQRTISAPRGAGTRAMDRYTILRSIY